MIKRILLALAGTSYTETAIRKAIELAKAHDASITATTVVDIDTLSNVGPVPIGGSETADELRKHRVQVTRDRVHDAIRLFAASCDSANVAYETREEEGDPFNLLVSMSRFHDVTMFGLRSVFEFNVASPDRQPDSLLMQLVTSGARPILGTPKVYRPCRRVLIAFGGSAESASSMKQFVQSQLWPNLDVQIVSFGNEQAKCELLLEHAKSYCAAHGIDAATRYVQGPSPKMILAAIEKFDADIVVLGSSHRNLLLRKIFGQTTKTVIEHSDRMVFLSK
jgi:nucleotide-binding universal stress UspA family protein